MSNITASIHKEQTTIATILYIMSGIFIFCDWSWSKYGMLSVAMLSIMLAGCTIAATHAENPQTGMPRIIAQNAWRIIFAIAMSAFAILMFTD